jgi:hypothetical protein
MDYGNNRNRKYEKHPDMAEPSVETRLETPKLNSFSRFSGEGGPQDRMRETFDNFGYCCITVRKHFARSRQTVCIGTGVYP